MDAYDVDVVLQRALDRLTLLAQVTTALTSTLDAREGMRRVCRILVPNLADWCVMDLLDEPDRLHRVCVTHRDPTALPTGDGLLLGDLAPVPATPIGPLARVLRGTGPLLPTEDDINDPPATADPLHAQHHALFEQLGAHTAIVAPLRTRRQVLGALTVVRTSPTTSLTVEDLTLVEDLAHRIALAVDNARLYQETQHIAERLQLSLLPDLPQAGYLQLTARYHCSQTTAHIGGDWYDSFILPRGDTTLIIGDIAGHDLQAAVNMSQLRNMLRGIACDRQEPPGGILRRLDTANHSLGETVTATCVYAFIEGPHSGPWQLHYANAGHPPPLLITSEGDTHYLTDGHSMLLGLDPTTERTSATESLPPGSTLLLYTDGLIERPGESLDAGLTRLRQHAAALVREPLSDLCDELIRGLAADSTDDIALLALRLPRPGTRDEP